MALTSEAQALPLLQGSDVLQKLEALRRRQEVRYYAFYSSQLGGVVTDPALMVLPFDDHMVHRGHGIFDTAAIVEGKIYDLDAHLDRFMRSAKASRLEVKPPKEEMRRIVIQTAAASGAREGSIRYWLSSGAGSFELGPVKGGEPGFFVMIFAGLSYPEGYYTQGMRVMTTTCPIKPPLYATTKSTNYLPNVLMQMEARERGLDNGIFVDAEGNVGEGSNMNVAFVSREGAFLHPRFDHILSGCTSVRLLELMPGLARKGVIKGFEVRDIPVAEAKESAEMLFIGSSINVAPIVEWDGQKIGDGSPGPVAKALLAVLKEDMRSAKERLIEVPY
ncbi:MAG: D-amino-acid transaminase [Candidatus Tectomicrobia bacterium]|nr:D-amino-acid transaminase [Candidatus Tectomicrobia bacterium]